MTGYHLRENTCIIAGGGCVIMHTPILLLETSLRCRPLYPNELYLGDYVQNNMLTVFYLVLNSRN